MFHSISLHEMEQSIFQRMKFFSLLHRPVCFVFERARAPRHFLLGKVYEEIVNVYWCILKAQRHLPGGMEAITFVASVKYRPSCIHYEHRINLPKTNGLKLFFLNVYIQTHLSHYPGSSLLPSHVVSAHSSLSAPPSSALSPAGDA